MKRQAHRQPSRAVGLTLAASTALAAFGGAATVAHAQTADTTAAGTTVSILTPYSGQSFEGSKSIEVSAFYQAGGNAGGITSVEILIDGQKAASKTLENPEAKGVVSFMIDPATLESGTHQILIRVKSLDGENASVKTSLTYNGPTNVAPVPSSNPGTPATSGAPSLMVQSPAPGAHVSGIVTIDVSANDPSGKPPYVSLFIDNTFKTLRNYPPYTFDWDTTRVSNGWHTIEVSGFNDSSITGKALPMRVYVNNGGGATIIMPLSDAVPGASTPKPAAPKPATPKPAPATPTPAPTSNAAPKPVAAPPADGILLAHPAMPVPDVSAHAPSDLMASAIQTGDISQDTLLKAPFLDKQAMPTGADVTPTTPAQLAAANTRDSSIRVKNPQQMASAIGEAPISPTTMLNAPFLDKQPLPVGADVTPTTPAKLARTKRSTATPATGLGDQQIASATIAPTVDQQTMLAAPFLDKLPPASGVDVTPTTPPRLARDKRRAAPAGVGDQKIASATVSPQLDPATVLNAPFVEMPAPVAAPTPAAPKATRSDKPKLARTKTSTPLPPAPSLGSQLLASIGFLPEGIAPSTLTSAPFLSQMPTPVSVSTAELARPETVVPPVTGHEEMTGQTMGPEVLAPTPGGVLVPTEPAPIQSKAPAAPPVIQIRHTPAPVPTVMASANIGAGEVVAPIHEHAPIVIAPPPSGYFSRAVRNHVRGQFEVVMNDHPLALDRPIQDHGNVLCAPIRQIFESQGGELFWSQKTKTVRAISPDRDVQIKIGSRHAIVNDKQQTLSTAAYINGGRTMIPIGFLPVALNVTVSYDPHTGHLLVNSK